MDRRSIFYFCVVGRLFFGNLKRSKQLEVLINRLQLQIIDKKNRARYTDAI